MSTADYRLGLIVEQADGRTYRWAWDEPDGRNVPLDLETTTSIPGGDESLNTSLLRELTRDNPDNALFDKVRLFGPGNATKWSGRMAQFPRQHGDSFTVEPGAVGMSAHLNDDTSFTALIRDIDLARWGAASNAWRSANGTNGYFQSDGQSVPDTAAGLPAIELSYAPAASTQLWAVSSEYDAGPGAKVGSVYANWVNGPGVPPVVRLYAALTDSGTTNETLISAAGAATHTLGTATRYLFAEIRSTGGALTAGSAYSSQLRSIAIYGDHSLTKRGTEPDVGFYPSDILPYILDRAAPLLDYTTGPSGSIEDAAVLIPHLVFDTPVTAAEAITRVSAFGVDGLVLPEWGVYNGTFFWRTPDPDRLCWQARVSDGARVRDEGDTDDELFNGVLVIYTDPAGKRKIAGPPAAYWHNGTALADQTDATLVNTDPANPVNAHGIPRKWAKLELSDPTTDAAALVLGAVFLAVQSQPQRRGEIELRGKVGHPTITGPQPVFDVKAGDHIQVTDGNEADREVKRRIVKTRYVHESRTLTATVGNNTQTLDGILEQLSAQLVGVVS